MLNQFKLIIFDKEGFISISVIYFYFCKLCFVTFKIISI